MKPALRWVGMAVLCASACAPVTGIALLQNNTDYFDFVRRQVPVLARPSPTPVPTRPPDEIKS